MDNLEQRVVKAKEQTVNMEHDNMEHDKTNARWSIHNQRSFPKGV